MKNKKLLFLITLSAVLIFPIMARADDATISGVVKNVADALSLAVGGFVVIAWIVVGVMFLASWSNPNRLSLAKSAFVWTVAGTMLFVLGYGILAIIANALAGA